MSHIQSKISKHVWVSDKNVLNLYCGLTTEI